MKNRLLILLCAWLLPFGAMSQSELYKRYASRQDLTVAQVSGFKLNDTACPYPYANDTAMVCNLNFDTDFAHFTFSDNVEIWQMVEMAGQYTMEQIQQMDLAYVYDGSTQTGTLTAVGMDENGQPINYQINFSYDITADSITIVFQFTNEQNVTVNFPMVFQRNATV